MSEIRFGRKIRFEHLLEEHVVDPAVAVAENIESVWVFGVEFISQTVEVLVSFQSLQQPDQVLVGILNGLQETGS